MSKKPTINHEVQQWLEQQPGYHTVAAIRAGIGKGALPTIKKALEGGERDGWAKRRPGEVTASGTRADEWAGTSTTVVDQSDTDSEPAQAQGEPDDAVADAASAERHVDAPTADDGDATGEAVSQDDPAAAPSTTDAADTSDESPADGDEPQARSDSTSTAQPMLDNVDEADDPNGPADRPGIRRDYKVIAAYAVLRDHADTGGVTAADLAGDSGLPEDDAWRALLALEYAGAAKSDRPYALDAEARWLPVETDTDATVGITLDNAPDTVACPCCGRDVPVPGARRGKTRSRGGGAVGGVRADGRPPLAPGELQKLVRDWVAAHPGEQFTPGYVQRQIPEAVSDGAVRNALMKMVPPLGDEVQVVKRAPLTFQSTASDSGGTAG